MNASCFADKFTRFGDLYIRCFLDGTIVKIKGSALPKDCPHCKRPMLAETIRNPGKFDEVLIKIDLPHYKRLAKPTTTRRRKAEKK